MVDFMKEILNELKKRTDEYELYLQNTITNEIHIQKNRINFTDKTVNSGYGVRVHENGMGFSSSNIFSKPMIEQTIKNALKSSEMTEKIKFNFPSSQKFGNVKNVDKIIKEDGERTVKSYVDNLLKSVEDKTTISFGKVRTYDSYIYIVNSEGIDLSREETTMMIELSIMLEKNGKKVEFWSHEYRRRMEDMPLSLVNEWIKFANDQLIATEPKTEKTTVIFSPTSVLDGLGSVISSHVTGESKLNKTSILKPNEKVAVKDLTVISDGLYPHGLMTSEFDDEGVPQRKNILIDKGVFQDYIYDQFYGIKDGRKSTGNGLRQGETFFVFNGKYGGMPGNQVSNFFVEPGKQSIEQLIKEVQHGILVNTFSWLYPDIITGNFSSEIRSGYYIKNGEVSQPIKGGLVTGNFFDLIKNISGISNKSVITSGGTILAGICPYIRFENVQIAGK